MIPNRCIQFWHDISLLPDELRKAIVCNVGQNPEFDFHLINDNQVFKLLDKKYPQEYLNLYKRIKIPSARSDIASYLWLYEFGGIYLDVSMRFASAFDAVFDFSDDLFFVRRDDIPKYHNCPEQAHAIVGIMGAKAHSDLMSDCLKQAFENIASGEYNYSVSQAVGPVMFNQVLATRKNKNQNANFYSFKQMLAEKSLEYLRVPGFANTWVRSQKDGIVDPDFYSTESLAKK